MSDPMDCSPLGLSVQGIFQARILEWDAISFSMIYTKCSKKKKKKTFVTIIPPFNSFPLLQPVYSKVWRKEYDYGCKWETHSIF